MALNKTQQTLLKNLIAILEHIQGEKEETEVKKKTRGRGKKKEEEVEVEDDLGLDGDLGLDDEDEDEDEDEDDLGLDDEGGMLEDDDNEELYDEIRDLLTKIAKRDKNKKRALAILKKFDAKDVLALDVDDLPKVIKVCKQVLAKK
jgi:hypothetical protein